MYKSAPHAHVGLVGSTSCPSVWFASVCVPRLLPPLPPRTVPKFTLPAPGATRHRLTSEANFADTEVDELISMLRETENLEEQGDILQYLVDTQGLDFNTGELDGRANGDVRFVHDVLAF